MDAALVGFRNSLYSFTCLAISIIFARLIALDCYICFLCIVNIKKAPANENCQANEIIFKEDQCKDAAKQIGEDYWKKINSDEAPLGCYYSATAKNGVLFNENINGPNKPGGDESNPGRNRYGGLCIVPGISHFTKMFT